MASRIYDENGNEKPSTKGIMDGECGKATCNMPGAKWFHAHLQTHVCEWCAKDANRMIGGVCELGMTIV